MVGAHGALPRFRLREAYDATGARPDAVGTIERSLPATEATTRDREASFLVVQYCTDSGGNPSSDSHIIEHSERDGSNHHLALLSESASQARQRSAAMEAAARQRSMALAIR